MEILNEDCLLYVFKYLEPNDWVSITEVCSIWEHLVSPFWPKVQTLAINRKNVPKLIENVPVSTVKKMIEAAGQYITNVSFDMSEWSETFNTRRVQFGKYLAMMQNEMNAIDGIASLAQVSGSITDVELRYMKLNEKDCAVFRSLIDANPGIKRLRFSDCSMDTVINNDVVMSSVEELHIYLYLHIYFNKLAFKHFKGSFPNLRTLSIFVDLNATINKCVDSEQVESFFYDVIPYAKKLKSLNVKINFRRSHDLCDPKFLLAFGDATEIEDLRIMMSVAEMNVNLEESILEKILSKSNNLRTVALSRFRISKANVERLLALPKLERLSLKGLIFLSQNMEIPTLANLYKLALNSVKGTLKYESVFNVINRMPALSELSLYGLSDESEIIFTRRLIVSLMSDNKQVLVNNAKCNKFLFRRLMQTDEMIGCNVSTFHFNIETENIYIFIRTVFAFVSKEIPNCTVSEVEC